MSRPRSPFAGDIAEILVYNRALSDADRQTVETYLKAKWSLDTLVNPVLSGIQLWLSANQINPADPTQVVSNNGSLYVADWRDLSPAGLHATQSQTGSQPMFIPASAINGKPAVRFDGNTSFLNTTLAQITGDKTVFVVENRTSSISGTEIGSTTGYGMFFGNNNGAETKGRFWIAHDLSLPGTINTPILKTFTRSGGTETLRLNDASTTASVDDGANGTYTISNSGYPFGGDIGEVIIYNRALADSERLAVENYLKARWSVYGTPIPVTAGLQMWLDASAFNASDSNRAVTSNGNIYAKDWLDRSPNAIHVLQTTAANQPLYVGNALNGRSVMRFNGTNNFMTSPFAQISGDKSIFIVQSRAATTSGKEISSSATSGSFFGNNVAMETVGRIGIAHDLQLNGNLGFPILKSLIRSGASETLRVDYNSVLGSAPDLASGTYTISSQTSPFAGDIAEIAFYNRALSDTERTQVESYLRDKWSASKFAVPVTSGLSMWLDASSINSNDPAQVVTDSNGIHLLNWLDRSLNNQRASQTTLANEPLYVPGGINGRPVVRFDGQSQYMYTSFPQFLGDKSIFVVQRRTSAAVGTEISSSNGSGIFFSNIGSIETIGRLNVAHDLQIQGGIGSPILKSLIRSGTTETMRVDGTAASGTIPDAAGGNFTLSSAGYPFGGDVGEILVYNRALSDTERQSVENYLNSKWYIYPLNDIRSVLPDTTAPPMSLGAPAPGVRVKQTSPEYANTSVYHTLYLPQDWQPGNKYPVIVEYAPNYVDASNNLGIGFTGNVEDTVIGYGITGGKGFIWISMPTITPDGTQDETTWWGSLATSEDYCLKTVRHVCENYGGDPSAVIICGFSRGAIATNYLGLNDDTIADVWLASICHSHYDGQITTWPYPNCDAASALTRLQRLGARNQFISAETTNPIASAYLQTTGVNMSLFTFETLPFINHCDMWALRPVQLRQDLNAWLLNVVATRPGTHSISGQITDSTGAAIPNARIQSGYTHFTFSDANGNYVLAGLIDSSRTLTVTATGYTLPTLNVTVAGSNVSGANIQAQ